MKNQHRYRAQRPIAVPVLFRGTAEDREMLRSAAAFQGVSMASFLRIALRESATKVLRERIEKNGIGKTEEMLQAAG